MSERILGANVLKCMVGKECCARSNRSLREDKDSRNKEGHLQLFHTKIEKNKLLSCGFSY